MTGKKACRAAAAAMAATLLAACGSGGADASGESAGAQGEASRTLQFMRPGTQDVVAEIFEPMLEEFESEHDAEVEIVELGWGEYEQRLTTMIATDRNPDVQLASQGYLYSFLEEDAYIPLTDYIDDELKAELPEALWDAATVDGEIYFVPAAVGGYVLWYNRELFEEAGLDPDAPPATLEELRSYAEQITAETDAAGIGIHAKQFVDIVDLYATIFSSNAGQPLWDAESGTFNFDSPEGVESLEYLRGLIVDGLTQPNPEEYDRGALREVFRDGDVAMVLDGPWIISALGESHDLEAPDTTPIRTAPVPAGAAGSHARFGADGWAISSDTENPDLAWELLRTLVTPENQQAHDVGYGSVPTQQSEREMAPFDQPHWQDLASALETGFTRAKSPHFLELQTVVQDAVQAAMLGVVSPQEAIDEAVAEAQTITEN